MNTGLQIVTAFTCESAEIHPSNAEMDVQAVYFQTAGESFPIEIAKLQVAGFVQIPPYWQGRNFEITVVLLDSDNQEIVRFKNKMKITPSKNSLTPMLPFVAPVEGLIAEGPGMLRIEIYLENELAFQIPFEIIQIKEELT